MTQDELKALVGRAALAHVVPGSVVGVGVVRGIQLFHKGLYAGGLQGEVNFVRRQLDIVGFSVKVA